MRPAVSLALMALLTLAVYSPSGRNGFVYEDRATVTQNPTVQMMLPVILHKPRSLSELSLRVNYAVSGLNPKPFHLTNVGVHVVNGLLVFALASRWLTPSGALASVAVFWLHPLQSEAVNYVTSRNELLACFFSLCAGLALLRKDWRWPHLLLGSLAIVAAILSKESAIGIIGVIALYRWLVPGQWSRPALIIGGLICAGVALGMAARILISDYGTAAIPVTDRGPWAYAGTQAAAIWRYAFALFWPTGLTVDHDFELLPIAIDSLALVILMACVYVAWGVREPFPLLALLLVSPLIILSPRFVMRIPEYLNEHQLYLPMVSVSLMLGLAYQYLREHVT